METLDTVLAKIQKLQRLATSSNPNEAALAAAKAAELIAAYQIEEAQLEVEIDESREEVESIVEDGVKGARRMRYQRWYDIVLLGVCTRVGCHVYKRYSGYGFIGRRSDVQAAVYLTGLITSDIKRMAKQSLKETQALPTKMYETPTRFTNGFKMGAAAVVQQRLFAESERQEDSLRADATKSNALLVLNKRADAIKRIAREKGISMRHGSSRRRVGSYDGYARGKAAGERVNIGNKAVGALGSAA